MLNQRKLLVNYGRQDLLVGEHYTIQYWVVFVFVRAFEAFILGESRQNIFLRCPDRRDGAGVWGGKWQQWHSTLIIIQQRLSVLQEQICELFLLKKNSWLHIAPTPIWHVNDQDLIMSTETGMLAAVKRSNTYQVSRRQVVLHPSHFIHTWAERVVVLAAVLDRGETGYSKLSKNNPTPVHHSQTTTK